MNWILLTFYTELRQKAKSPTSPSGLGSVCESLALPQLKCSSGPPLPGLRAFLAGFPAPGGQQVRPSDGEQIQAK